MLRVYGVQAGSSVADNTYVPPPVVRYGGAAASAAGAGAQCDPLFAACGAQPTTQPETPAAAPNPTGDTGAATGPARMPNLRATASARWQNGKIRVTVHVLISKPRLVQRSFLVRVRTPSLGITRLVRVNAGGHGRRTLHLAFPGPASTIGKRVVVNVDPTKLITEIRERDNSASARIG